MADLETILMGMEYCSFLRSKIEGAFERNRITKLFAIVFHSKTSARVVESFYGSIYKKDSFFKFKTKKAAMNPQYITEAVEKLESIPNYWRYSIAE
jgi:hypothetical protein